ncbi:MAG: hypothetical protein JXA36_03505 [Coriobacteriia bacterium]|nr:hypothetical protein [Coriobacteriia bacterium]
MPSARDESVPVRVKVVLIDPASMTVLWMNEAAAESVTGSIDDSAGLPVERVVPMAEALGVGEALNEVASTGVARHLQADLVSTGKGSMALVVSVYRLPGGELLVVAENTWQAKRSKADDGLPRRSGRR